LKAPDVPSVLVELGFLSNRQDEELLNSPDWRQQTAGSIVLGIDDFFATRRLAGIPAR
jgi:N-acetylmuramoyl-L-alanine amidase